jgi:hypothetical protein
MKRTTTTPVAVSLLAIVFAVVFTANAGSGGTDDRAAASAGERFDIVGLCIPPANEMSVARFREMAECGLTAGMMAQAYDEATKKAALNAAARARIKLFVLDPDTTRNPEAVAAKYRDCPSVAGYFVADEPTWGPAGWSSGTWKGDVNLGDVVARLKKADPARQPYINLFPNYASPKQLGTPTYQEHVDRFVAEVPGLDLLSFDHYPIAGFRVRDNWYENLEIISRAARKKGVPLWAFALTSTHYDFTPATPEHLKLQMHVNLAYGAQVLQYFPYWAPNGDHWHAPINVDGTRSKIYGHLKGLNAGLQSLAPIFKGARVVDIAHTGPLPQWRTGGKNNPAPWPPSASPIPKGTQPYMPSAPVVEFAARGQAGAVVSTLQKGNRCHLVVVNKDCAHMMTLEIALDGSLPVEAREDYGKPVPVKGKRFETLVAPSGLVILSWACK